MASETVRGTGSTKTANIEEGLTKEQKEKILKARKPMVIANNFRLFFLFAAFFVLVIMLIGEKIWAEAAWFDSAVENIYRFLLGDILLMLLSTFVKFFFVVRYNKVVTSIKK